MKSSSTLQKPAISKANKKSEPLNPTKTPSAEIRKDATSPSHATITKKRNLMEAEERRSCGSSSSTSQKNVQQLNQNNQSKTSTLPRSSSTTTTTTRKTSTTPNIDEMARRAFLSSEQQYLNELSKRKQPSTPPSASKSVPSVDNLFKISKDVLHERVDKPDEKELLAGASDLEAVIIVSTEAHIKTTPSPVSLDPNHCHFSILEQLQQRIPIVKKHVEYIRNKVLEEASLPKSKLKQPSKKTKQAIANQKAFEKSPIELPMITSTRMARRKITRIEPISSKTTNHTKIGQNIVLPYELVINIFSFLPWKELYTVIMRVSKNWKEFVTEYEYFIICEHSRLNFFSASQVLICSGCYNEVPELCKACSQCSNSIDDHEDSDELSATSPEIYYKRRLQAKVDKWILNYWKKHREQIDEMNREPVTILTSDANENPVNEPRSTPSLDISIRSLSQKCKEYIISQIFPNTWHLTGKGLTLPFVSMFREQLSCLHYFPAESEENKQNTISLESKTKKKKKNTEKTKTPISELVTNFTFPKLTQIFWSNSTLLDAMSLNYTTVSNFHQMFANVEKFISTQSLFFSLDISKLFDSNMNRLRILDLSQCKLLQNYQLEILARTIGEHARKCESDIVDERKCLRKVNLSGCGSITQNGLHALAEHCGRTIKCLHLNTYPNCKEISLNQIPATFEELEELSLEGNYSFHSLANLVNALVRCKFGSKLKILNIKSTFIMPHHNELVRKGVASSITQTTTSSSSSALTPSPIIDLKHQLVRIFDWMLPKQLEAVKKCDLKLVLTDLGEFYYQRNHKRNTSSRFVWRNRVHPFEAVAMSRSASGCYLEQI
ncbi:hypothetical protein C9374_007301 [Naegleria lovaniensis]|uniref:F-box domain-containing protein n=1 Tax=Naegleria lovaniensis TaxID=51637 RepID=A0AA88GZG1_NAELO|nr:uncharacterized protein C9374_007301 [Naegleria lovaniensis]KAG2393770.1 hypothetical protein C9374_007301 [Naegleria lovaniensis]